jgi:hypothetical protein
MPVERKLNFSIGIPVPENILWYSTRHKIRKISEVTPNATGPRMTDPSVRII